MIKLSKDKIRLRATEVSDIDTIYQWENNEEHWLVSNTIVPFSKYTIELFIQNAQKDIFETKQARFMIELLNQKETVGCIDIFDFDPYNLKAGIGILINDKINREKGYASEALDIIIEYCHKHLGLKQLYASISEDNKKSIKLFESKEFTLSGVKKQWQRTAIEEWKDILFYQLIF